MAKGVYAWVGKTTGHKVKGQIKVGEREVGKEQLDELIDKLDVEEDLAGNAVVRGKDLAKLNE